MSFLDRLASILFHDKGDDLDAKLSPIRLAELRYGMHNSHKAHLTPGWHAELQLSFGRGRCMKCLSVFRFLCVCAFTYW